MSFDLSLQKFAAGDEVSTASRPVLDVLKSIEHKSQDDGWYIIHTEDENPFEFCAEGLSDGDEFRGAQFRLFSLTHSVSDFVYRVADAGVMAIFNAQADAPKEPMIILPRSARATDLADDLVDQLGQPAVVSSGDELRELLTGGVARWDQFRRRANY